ncbi:dynein light chain roadblock-type 2-like [Epargyreus clarus]|uniref:dynein light chain roadblock-type 2-like n=1 Tax=Epargyreus clarus TaxID=520877 RepID=UPI003C2DEBD2
MKIMSNLLKDSRDEWLVKTTASINNVNPIIDRIMDDESVESVIMTNKEGAPILTNINLTSATNFGIALSRLGVMTQICITEVDPLDEVLILRVNTKKMEIMVAPHREFNIIVVQHGRHKLKQKTE